MSSNVKAFIHTCPQVFESGASILVCWSELIISQNHNKNKKEQAEELNVILNIKQLNESLEQQQLREDELMGSSCFE